MRYEVRENRQVVAVYERQRDALARVKALIAQNPDSDAEIVDARSGAPAEPGATKQDRDDYATKVGF